MESTDKGIDISEREMLALLAFCGDSADQAQVIFKVKGKRIQACATNKRSAVEYTGANAGGEEGEFPVAASFLKLCAAAAVEGSKHVPGKVARLLVQRTGIRAADIVVKESGEAENTITCPKELEPNKQLRFKDVHDTLDFDVERKGHWFATDMRHTKPLAAVQAAADKCPITWVPATDELSPVGFIAKGGGGDWRGVLRPVETAGPGKAATNPDDDEEDDGDERQPGLFSSKANGKAAAPEDDAGSDDSGVVDDDYAERVKAQQARAEGDLPTAKKQRKARKPKAGAQTN